MSRRRIWDLLERLLLLACAGYWFGNSGLGLAVLLLATRGGPPGIPAVQSLLDAESRSIWIGADRVMVRCAREGRLEIYRDEVSESEWTRLRRGLLGQPATGRSTSI